MERATPTTPTSRDYLQLHWMLPISVPFALEPWKDVIQQWSIKYRWCNASPASGVVAVVLVNVKKLMSEGESGEMSEDGRRTLNARMVALREAMELWNLHFQLHPRRLRIELRNKSAILVDELDQQGVRLDVVDLEFELKIAGGDSRLLRDVVAPMLSSRSQRSLFRTLCTEYTASIEKRKAIARPNHVTIDTKIQAVPDRITNWHVERFFSDLAGFADYSAAVQVDGISQTDAAAFVVKRIYISINSISITPSVVQRVQKLVRIQPHLIVFDTLTLDPRMLACGNDDIENLVQTVCDVSPQVHISTGHLPPRNVVCELDNTGHEPPDRLIYLVRGILRAIGCAKSLNGIDLSLLMYLLPKRQHRKVIWKAFAECSSHALAAGPIHEFAINAPVMLDDEDAKVIRGERQNTGKRRRIVKSLTVEVAKSSDSAVLELVSLVAGLESLSLSRRQGTFSASMLLEILKRAPRLHTLEVDQVAIECKTTVSKLIRATNWQSLSMVDVEVADVSVISTFVRELGDPTCPLAKSLRVLRLSSRTNSMAVCNEAVYALSKALRSNHVLQDLHLAVQNDVSQAAIAAVRSHHGDIVRHPQPRQRAAFLSVLKQVHAQHPFHRFDEHVVQIIFSFSVIHLRRQVHVRLAPL